MPVTFGQELGAWRAQVRLGRERIESTLPRVRQLAIGATAVGTGINAHPDFGRRVRVPPPPPPLEPTLCRGALGVPHLTPGADGGRSARS